jgi:hypothetical protein
MSLESRRSPLPPPVLQEVAGALPLSIPSWLGRRGISGSKHQPHQRRTEWRLLKKASPDPSTPPSHHHDDLTGSFTIERPTLRRSTEAQRLHEKGRTTSLEMPASNPLPCHASYHRRRAARKMKTWERLARPMELSDRLRFATYALSLPNLQLQPTLRTPEPLLRHLQPTLPPREASDWSGRDEATLKGGAESMMKERREESVLDLLTCSTPRLL